MQRLLIFLLSAVSVSVSSAFVPIAPKTCSKRPSVNPPSTKAYESAFTRDINNNGWYNAQSRTSRGSSQLAATPAIALPKLAAVGVSIAKFYKTFPLIAGFLTAGTKAGFADRLAQYRDVCTTKFDVKRNLAMVMYSGLILGVTVEIMYNRCFPLLFGAATVEKNIARAVKMTLFDAFINAPLLWLPPAYLAQAVAFQYPFRDAINKYVTDVRENGLLKKYWSLWLPASLINFTFIPPHFRVAFVASISFFWMIVLSIVANNGDDQDVESCPLEPEPAMKNPRALD